MNRIRVGTAGWSIPRDLAGGFPTLGTALERYASRLGVAEINSSFHRPHRLSTWERWRDSVPPDFRFSVKLPKQITHKLKLTAFPAMRSISRAQPRRERTSGASSTTPLPPRR